MHPNLSRYSKLVFLTIYGIATLVQPVAIPLHTTDSSKIDNSKDESPTGGHLGGQILLQKTCDRPLTHMSRHTARTKQVYLFRYQEDRVYQLYP